MVCVVNGLIEGNWLRNSLLLVMYFGIGNEYGFLVFCWIFLMYVKMRFLVYCGLFDMK